MPVRLTMRRLDAVRQGRGRCSGCGGAFACARARVLARVAIARWRGYRQGVPSEEGGWFDDGEAMSRREPGSSRSGRLAVEDGFGLARIRAGRDARLLGGVDRRVTVVAAAVLVTFVSILAAAGVFGGANPAPAPLSLHFAAIPRGAAASVATGNAPRLPLLTTTLKPGASGSQVRALQRALASLGFQAGTIDGDYGPATTSAVKRFQQSAKLTTDGILGPRTLQALNNALKGP